MLLQGGVGIPNISDADLPSSTAAIASNNRFFLCCMPLVPVLHFFMSFSHVTHWLLIACDLEGGAAGCSNAFVSTLLIVSIVFKHDRMNFKTQNV